MIKIDEHYSIETDAYNFTLKFEKATGTINEKTGKESVSRSEWYFPSLISALNKYTNESLKSSQSIDELKAGLETINQTINNLKLN